MIKKKKNEDSEEVLGYGAMYIKSFEQRYNRKIENLDEDASVSDSEEEKSSSKSDVALEV